MKYNSLENKADLSPDEIKYELSPEEYLYEVGCDPDHPYFVGEPDRETKLFYYIALVVMAIPIIASIILEG